MIPATAAPIAAVIARRGGWVLLARWDLRTARVEHGAWFRGTIYQRRCDVSPDGVWFYYFALKGGRAFHAVSRLPWLTSLALWRDDTTYGGGAHFEAVAARGAARGGVAFRDPADDGTIAPLTKHHGMRLVPHPAVPYSAERRRGWREHPHARPPAANDHFDERRAQWLVRDQPTGARRLELRDRGYQRGRFEGRAPAYALDGEPLEGVTWADWDRRGRLLIATREGSLEIRDHRGHLREACSLVGIAPDPRVAPSTATRW